MQDNPSRAKPLDSGLPTLSCIGSHSALDVCLGARREGLRNLVVAARGREQTYARHYRSRPDGTGCVDETLMVDHFAEILDPEVQKTLSQRNAVFVPSRSFQVYARQRHSHDAIERQMQVPMFGSRWLLRAEDRSEPSNQYDLLDKAGIRRPRRLRSVEEIDGLTLVKAAHAKVPHERAFFVVASATDCKERAGRLLSRGLLSDEGLTNAILEEYVVGPAVNLNFFWSPILGELELAGTDTRRQTNLDGALSLLAADQTALGNEFLPSMEEAGHISATLTESMLEQAFELGERLVAASAEMRPPGIIGPFALQCVISAGPPKTFVVYDVSLRIPGSPGTKYTPYSAYRWGREMSMGERIAKEVAMAQERGRLAEVCT